MLALGTLVFVDLHLLREQQPTDPAASPPRTTHPSGMNPSVVVVTAARITIALGEISEPLLPQPTEEPMGKAGFQWVHRSYQLQVPRPRDLEELVAPFRDAVNEIPEATFTFRETKEGVELQYGVAGVRTHTVRFSWLSRTPRVSVVLAGLGDDLFVVRQLLELHPRPSFAIRPSAAFADVVAERLAMEDAEILVEWTEPSLEASPAESQEDRPLATRLAEAFQRVPHSSGLLLRSSDPDPSTPRPDTALFAAVRQHVSWVVLSPMSWAKENCADARRMRLACTGIDDDLEQTHAEVLPERVLVAAALARSAGDRILLLPARADAVEALRESWKHWSESGLELVRLSDLLLPDSLRSTHRTDGNKMSPMTRPHLTHPILASLGSIPEDTVPPVPLLSAAPGSALPVRNRLW